VPRRTRLLGFRVAALALCLLGTLPGGGYTASQPADLLFWTRYEETTALAAPTDCSGRQCWQSFTGTDDSTGHAWRPAHEGIGRFQMLADAPVDAKSIGNYMVNRIDSGAGRNGSRALYMEIKRSGCCGTDPQVGGATQDPYLLEPKGADGDMYISYWLKFQPNLEELMGRCGPNLGWHWRSVFEWKTAGDYRLTLIVQRDRDPDSCAFKGPLYWAMSGDDNANCNLFAIPRDKKCPPPPTNRWSEKNRSVPVPLDQWFKVEVFWHRSSGDDGRAWMAANGKVILDHRGPNTGNWNAPVNRIMTHLLYTSTAYPVFQWVDDLQVWRGFPTVSSTDPWYDPPYAPH
jgi:hypothetical protein